MGCGVGRAHWHLPQWDEGAVGLGTRCSSTQHGAGSAAGAQLGALLPCCSLMSFLPPGLAALLPFNSFLWQLIRALGEVRAASQRWRNPIRPRSGAGPRHKGDNWVTGSQGWRWKSQVVPLGKCNHPTACSHAWS